MCNWAHCHPWYYGLKILPVSYPVYVTYCPSVLLLTTLATWKCRSANSWVCTRTDWQASACWKGAADIAKGEQCPIAFAPRVHAQLTAQDIWSAHAYKGEFMTPANYCKEQTKRAWVEGELQWEQFGPSMELRVWHRSSQQMPVQNLPSFAPEWTCVWRKNLDQSGTSDATKLSVAPRHQNGGTAPCIAQQKRQTLKCAKDRLQ